MYPELTGYVVIDYSTRKVEIAGIIPQAYGKWMEQIARNLTDPIDGFLKDKKYLIHDLDPLKYVDGMNMYEYVKSNPVINVDPYGLKCIGKENCVNIGGIYTCPRQSTTSECQQCCDHIRDNMAKPFNLDRLVLADHKICL